MKEAETNPQLFSQNNMQIIDVDYILDYEIKREYRGKFRWNLNISKVFYFKKLPIQSELDPYVEIRRKKRRKVDYFQALIIPEHNLIKGPFEYQENIEEDFFDQLIHDNICKKVSSDCSAPPFIQSPPIPLRVLPRPCCN